jgi:hypothetical protein
VRFVGRIPTRGFDAATERALRERGVRLEMPTDGEIGVDLEAPSLHDAYARIVDTLRGCGIELAADDFTMPLYRTGPGTIALEG